MKDRSDPHGEDSVSSASLKVGGVAAFLTLALYCVEFFTFAGIPASVREWLELFGRSRLQGLFYVNALDILSVSLLLPFYMALGHASLRAPRARGDLFVRLATPFAFLGIAVFVAVRSSMTLGIMNLSERYVSASTQTSKDAILSAGEAISSLGQATPLSPGFFFIALASFLISFSLFRRKGSRAAAVAGFLSGATSAIAHGALALIPSVTPIAMIPSGLCMFAFWALGGVFLVRYKP